MTPLRERIEQLRRFTAQKVAVVEDELAGKRMPLYLDRSDVLAALDEPWTSERPTLPGDYWLSAQPSQRDLSGATEWPQLATITADGLLRFMDATYTLTNPAVLELLAGAKWQRRTTPPDPFADKSEDKDR